MTLVSGLEKKLKEYELLPTKRITNIPLISYEDPECGIRKKMIDMVRKVHSRVKNTYLTLIEHAKDIYEKLPELVKTILKAAAIGVATYIALILAYAISPEAIGGAVKELVKTYLTYRGINMSVDKALKYTSGVPGVLAKLSAASSGIYLATKVLKSLYDGAKSAINRVKNYFTKK